MLRLSLPNSLSARRKGACFRHSFHFSNMPEEITVLIVCLFRRRVVMFTDVSAPLPGWWRNQSWSFPVPIPAGLIPNESATTYIRTRKMKFNLTVTVCWAVRGWPLRPFCGTGFCRCRHKLSRMHGAFRGTCPAGSLRIVSQRSSAPRRCSTSRSTSTISSRSTASRAYSKYSSALRCPFFESMTSPARR